jgi:cyclophilin family peptidyl-prolyl cis-trans isomerase
VSKRTVIAAALVAAGIVAVYGVYQFQANRLTPGRLKAMSLAKERVAKAETVAQKAAEKKAEPAKPAAPVPAASGDGKRPEAPVELKDVGEMPATFNVQFHTTAGDFTVQFKKDLAPAGVERVYQLVKTGYFDGAEFFRVVPGFVVQFGMADKPEKTLQWIRKMLPPEPVKGTNRRGTVTFAMGGSPDTRSTQLFINTGDNANLDAMGFGPVGEVVKGMDIVDKLNSQYGEQPTGAQQQIAMQGNEFLDKAFPGLDRIVWAAVVKDEAAPAPAPAAAPAPAPAPGK